MIVNRLKYIVFGLFLVAAVLQSQAQTVESLNEEAIEFLKQENYEKAVSTLTKAIKTKPSYAESYFNMGFTYYCMSRYDDAMQWYKKTIIVDSNYADAYVNVGLVYNQKKQYSEAIEWCRRALSKDSTLANAHTNMGVAYGGLALLLTMMATPFLLRDSCPQ